MYIAEQEQGQSLGGVVGRCFAQPFFVGWISSFVQTWSNYAFPEPNKTLHTN